MNLKKRMVERYVARGVRSGWTRKETFKRCPMTTERIYCMVRRFDLFDKLAKLKPEPRPGRPDGSRSFDPEADSIPFWMFALRRMVNAYNASVVAKALDTSPVSVYKWFKGEYPLSYSWMAKIASASGFGMPDWRSAVREIVEREGGKAQAAKHLGLSRTHVHNMLIGKRRPREDTLQRILESTGRNYMVKAV